ncbi:hypothetical protein CRUP_012040 [Coryphaenoides rupestris]|nr:hypothetical protein CRUP_012040 [Coryphaenoides rupestris]
MSGYINNTLSVFNVADFSNTSGPLSTPYWFQQHNHMPDFRNPPGHPEKYQLQRPHIVYFTKFVLSYVIPDVPERVKEQIKREKYLTQVIIHEANLKLVTRRLKPRHDDDAAAADGNGKEMPEDPECKEEENTALDLELELDF